MRIMYYDEDGDLKATEIGEVLTYPREGCSYYGIEFCDIFEEYGEYFTLKGDFSQLEVQSMVTTLVRQGWLDLSPYVVVAHAEDDVDDEDDTVEDDEEAVDVNTAEE